MKQIHHLWLSVYCKPEDNEKDILENLRKFFPFNIEDEKLKIERQKANIIKEERDIIIFEVHLEKTSHTNAFLKHLNEILNDSQKQLIIKQKESRLDADHHFFLRFDKDKLIENNQFFITDKGNCYHMKMTIAAFPTTRENALKAVEKLFT
jgi:RNA binding exosome subunit